MYRVQFYNVPSSDKEKNAHGIDCPLLAVEYVGEIDGDAETKEESDKVASHRSFRFLMCEKESLGIDGSNRKDDSEEMKERFSVAEDSEMDANEFSVDETNPELHDDGDRDSDFYESKGK